MRKIAGIACIGLLLLTVRAAARDIYIAPAGTDQGAGSRDKPLDWAAALAANGAAKPGDTIWMLPGQYDGAMTDQSTSPTPFVAAVSGTAEAPLRICADPAGPVVVNGSLHITGSHVHVAGLEIGHVGWKAAMKTLRPQPSVRVGATHGVKLINCNLFGGAGGGIEALENAVDLELYGCLIHDFGNVQVSQAFMDIGNLEVMTAGSGGGVISANGEGTKTFNQCMIYRGCSHNMLLGRTTKGYDFLDTMSFLSVGLKPNESSDSFMIAGGYTGETRLDRIRVLGCVGYQPSQASQWRPNMRAVSYRNQLNGAVEVRDNVFFGSYNGVQIDRWQSLQFTGNHVWSVNTLVNIAPRAGEVGAGGYTVDHNVYYGNEVAQALNCDGDKDFAQWQAAGLDPHGSWQPGRNGYPTGTLIRVFTNKHQSGRGQVAVFNWDQQRQIAVDLSPILKKGTAYRIYHLLDIGSTLAAATVAVEGTYQGGEVLLPAQRRPNCPHLEAFLVLPAEPAGK